MQLNLNISKMMIMWFNFILGLNFILLRSKPVHAHYHAPKKGN